MVSLNSQPQIQTTQWFDTTHVVAIGVDQYTHPISSLNNAVNDAIEVAKIFGELKSLEKIERHLFLGLKKDSAEEAEIRKEYMPCDATKEAIENFLENLADNLKKKEHLKGKKTDRLVFYFAGHGVAIPFQDNYNSSDSSSESISQSHKPRGYLLLQDANQDKPQTFLPLDSLLDLLGKIPVQQCLVILDSCYAGAVQWSLFKTRDLIRRKTCPSLLDLFIDSPGWQIITSADETQTANDAWNNSFTNNRGSNHNSPFVTLLRQALLDDKDNCYKNSVATATELNSYLYRHLQKETYLDGKRQTPEIFKIPGKHVRGEFVFLQGTFEEVGKYLQENSPDPKIDEKENPYRGLLSYSSNDGEIFFGRKRLIDKLLNRVKQNKFPLTVVLGASGSGKSSLVKAGLIPNSQSKVCVEFRPGLSPGDCLEQARKDLQIDSILPVEKRLLVIDQFEEVETQCQDKEQKNKFWQELIKLITENADKIDVVLTLRSDFETTLRSQFESAFRENFQFQTKTSNYWLDARFTVPTMEREELEEVIEKPASTKAVFFEDKVGDDGRTLVQRLIYEVAEMPGALPLLSVALESMYQNFAKRYVKSVTNGELIKREINEDDYKSLEGGVVSSLTKRAKQLYEELVKDDAYRHTVRQVMLRMISLQGNGLTRRQVPKSELEYPDIKENDRVERVIERFSTARLIVEGSNLPLQPYVEPAHDALVRGWDKLQEWIKEDVKDLILQSLNAQVSDWKNNEKPETRLWHDDDRLPRLKQVLENEAKNWLNKQETEFVEQSIKQKRKQEDELTQNRINELTPSANARFKNHEELDALITALKAGKLVQKLVCEKSLVLTEQTYANLQLMLRQILSKIQEYDRFEGTILPDGEMIERENQFLFQLNSQPISNLKQRYLKDALSFSPDELWFVKWGEQEGSIELRNSDGTLHRTISAYNRSIMTARFSPNSQMIATGGWDSEAKLWNLDGTLLKTFAGHQSFISAVAFSHDGQMIATASGDKTVKIWNLEGTLLKTLEGHKGEIWGVSISPNSQMIASASQDKTIKLWNLDGTLLKTLEGHEKTVRAVAFSADGQFLASSSDDRTVKIWKLDGTSLKILDDHIDVVHTVRFSPNGQIIATTSGHGYVSLWRRDGTLLSTRQWQYGPITTLDFSPDGERIVIAAGDRTLRLSMTDGTEPILLEGHTGGVYHQEVLAVSFSPNSQMIASGSVDGKIELWNRNGTLIRSIEGHNALVRGISFSPNGKIIASASWDETVKLWNSENGSLIKTFSHNYKFLGVAFSPDENQTKQIIAAASADGTVKLWNGEGEEMEPLQGHQNVVSAVAFSHDGQIIATGSWDNTVKLWNREGKLLTTLYGHTDYVNAVAFSTDGNTIASASNDATVILWDLDETLELDGLIESGRRWVEPYLTNNPSISDGDRQIILNINKNP